MAAWTAREGEWREPDPAALEAARERAMHPVGRPAGDLGRVREALYQVMWDDAGILRDAAGLARARARLRELGAELRGIGVAGDDLRYNLTWHDWLNLESLIFVSEAICAAAEARTDSRGAHFREDHPETGDLAASAFSRVRLAGGAFEVSFKPVEFTRVRPGHTLLAA
jgi:fumarate reductase flavoprotein subunit